MRRVRREEEVQETKQTNQKIIIIIIIRGPACKAAFNIFSPAEGRRSVGHFDPTAAVKHVHLQ